MAITATMATRASPPMRTGRGRIEGWKVRSLEVTAATARAGGDDRGAAAGAALGAVRLALKVAITGDAWVGVVPLRFAEAGAPPFDRAAASGVAAGAVLEPGFKRSKSAFNQAAEAFHPLAARDITDVFIRDTVAFRRATFICRA